MKLLKTLFAVSAVAASVQANAAAYNLTGTLTSLEATVNTEQAIGLIARANTTINNNASVSGVMNIDAPAASVAGSLAVGPYVSDSYVEQYGELTDEEGNGTGVNGWFYLANVLFDWANNGYGVNAGATSWDAATRTLSYTGTAANSGTAVAPGCSDTAGGLLCSFGPQNTQVSETFTMSLVFSEDMKSFTGVASISDYDESALIDTDGDQVGDLPLFVVKTNYSISGSEVPVPAAAWLFGSALVGLAGAARRRA